jgi:hypothetical protein
LARQRILRVPPPFGEALGGNSRVVRGVTVIAIFGLASGGTVAEVEDLSVADDPMVFKRLDADHDGLVSRQEAQSVVGLVQAFDTADANRDRHLDPTEFAVALPPANRSK